MILNKKKFQMNSETLLPFIMERTNKMLVITDYDNMFQVNYVNDCKFLKKLGYKYTELVGTSFLSLFNPDNVSKINDLLKNKSHTPSQLHEIRMRAKNGDIYWVEMAIDEFVTEDRENKKLISLTDISKQKELESQLEEFKKRFEKTSNTNLKIKYKDLSTSRKIDQTLHNPYEIFKNIIENIPQHIFWKDHNLVYLGCNQNYAKLIGQSSPECIIGQADCELLWDKKIIYLNNEKEFNVINSKNAEYHVIESWTTEDGRKISFNVNRIPLFDSNGKAVVILVTYDDITERQRMGIALRESEARLRTAIESLPFEVFMVDKTGQYIMQNTTCKNNWGDVIGKRPEDIAEDEDAIKIWKNNHLQAFSGETVRGEVNYQINGETRFFYNIMSPIYIENEVQNIIGVYIDITELKAFAQKTRESEETFRTITEQSFMGVIIIQDGIFKYFNEQTRRLNGYSNEEIKSWGPYEFSKIIHPEDKDFVMDQAKKKEIGAKNVVQHHKYRIITKTGEIRWIENFSKTINYEGKLADLVMFIDITEKLVAEQKLKESEEKYHQLFETSPDGVILTDSEGNIIECNSALESITGYPLTEYINKNFLNLEMSDQNVKDHILECFNHLSNNNKLGFVEFPFIHKNKKLRWVQITGSHISIKAQTRLLFVLHDITSQKNAEKALKKSRAQYRDLLETSSVGVMEIDIIKNQINYVNPKLLEITGYRKEELSNDSLLEKLINPKDLPKLIESNEEMDLEFRIKDKNGKLKWVSGRRLPHFDEFGNLISTRLWLDDITEKKIYEELIYELNVNFLNFTADIQNNINLLLKTGLKLLDGDLILYAHRIKTNDQDLYYIITSDNDSYTYDYKEFSENLVINEFFNEGHDFPQSIIGIDKEKYIYTDPFVKEIQAKGCFGKAIRSQEEMEDILCVFYKRNPIINGQDKLVLFLISDAIEIEQRRWQVQQDLEEQNTTLNKINKLKTELFSRTSHELKTPLISIKGFTELLLTLHKSKLDPETISILKEIKDGSKRLEKIINLLLESAKLEAGQLELKKSKEDLTFLINFCVKELKGLTTLRNQSVFFDSNNIIKAFLDKERIYEVISNLLLNAVKYTPPGGIISIKIYTENNDHIVSITDNGIGFTEEEKKQVFKQFGKIERYGQGWDVAIEGTGLGLYITKKLVELHGGKIWLESEGRDKGTTFNFSIPMNI